jgi:hypothetical protein
MEMAMTRIGTVSVLGAGASVDAGYPTAADLLNPFKTAVDEVSRRELERREQIMQEHAELERQATNPPPGRIILLPGFCPQPTTGEWFQTVWQKFEAVTARLRPLAVPKLGPDGRPHLPSAVVYGPTGLPLFTDYSAPLEGEPPSPAPTPYLETFFAFYDDYMRPMIAAVEGDPGALTTTQHGFRRLRELAVQTAFRVLSAYRRPPATYLRRLFELRGPEEYGCAIATLNFDVTIEQIASASSTALWDGFALKPIATSISPPEWNEPGLEKPNALWRAVAENGHEFVGFEHAPADAILLLKLHGSLGWYALEQGVGDIGFRDELRHNTVYKHFRIPYELLWRPEMRDLVDQLASGGSDDPVTHTQTGSLSRKAGAVWIRPYLIFARAMKAHPDRLSLDLMATFARLLGRAAMVLVIGYSWGDPHVNDLIFDAVAHGASLVNVSRSALPSTALALWMQRFPTTFHVLRKRLFMFGGGAKRVLEEGSVELPSGGSLDLDLIGSVARGLPIELSLERTLS